MKKLFAAVTACFLLACFMTAGCTDKPEEYPSAEGGTITKTGHRDAVEVEIDSLSMRPTFEYGDKVLVQKTDISEINEGDIIAFKNGDRTYVHRVFVKGKDSDGRIYFRTAGDMSVEGDNFPVYEDMLIGKVL